MDIETAKELKWLFDNMRIHSLERKDHIKKYYKARRIHSQILNSMIDYFEAGKYDLDKEMKKLEKEIDRYLANGKNRNFKLKFDMSKQDEANAFYNMFVYKNHPVMKSLTEIYLENNKFRKEEKVEFLKAMNDSFESLFKIMGCDSEHGYVTLKDVFTGKEIKIIDVAMSGVNVLGEYIYNRIITYDGMSFMTGVNAFLGKNEKEILERVEEHKKQKYCDFIKAYDFYNLSKKYKIKSKIHGIK